MRGPRNDGDRRANAWALIMLFCVTCCLAIDSTAQGATVRDEFDAISYSGNNGTANWTGNWIEAGEADGPSSGFLRVTSNAACIAGNCMRIGWVSAENQNKWLYREADLSGATTATLTYDYATLNDNRGWVHVEVNGNGSGWVTLASYDTELGPQSGSESFNITAYIDTDTQVRFRGTNKDDDTSQPRDFRGFLTFDDIEISSDAPSVLLDIVKRAFEADGTVISTGSVVPNYLEIRYLLYINNKGAAVDDVSVRDILDAAFQYQAGTIKVDNSVAECALTACTAAEELTIFTAVDATIVLSDSVDGDAASYTGGSAAIDVGNGNAGNPQLNINADAVWAILFSVKMP